MLTLLWFAGVLELFGGFFVLIGLFTRPVAFLLSGEMAVAYWMAHAPNSLFPALTAATPQSSTASSFSILPCGRRALSVPTPPEPPLERTEL